MFLTLLLLTLPACNDLPTVADQGLGGKLRGWGGGGRHHHTPWHPTGHARCR